MKQREITFLALGDSYTIGEAVEESQRWPVQLAKKNLKMGLKINDPTIIATTGWTTDELLKAIRQAMPIPKYDLVSLQIGVNNQYRGYPIDQYEKEFKELLDIAVGVSKNDNKGAIVISIPDYSVTPFGQKKNPKKTTNEIEDYNKVASKICVEKNVTFIDITDLSRRPADDPDLIASDGLHPSRKMYSQWAELILPKIRTLFE